MLRYEVSLHILYRGISYLGTFQTTAYLLCIISELIFILLALPFLHSIHLF